MVSTLAELRPLSSQREKVKTSRLYCYYPRDPIKNQEKKKNRKRKSKIQEDIYEESLKDCPSWW
jgi:hypothetical protein